jgi:FkbM family methyltransferase
MLNKFFTSSSFTGSETFRELQAKPLGFIDVGARGGVHSVVEPLANLISVLAFEADINECERLEKIKNPYAHFAVEPKALGRDYKKNSLHILRNSVNSSLLHPNHNFAKRYQISGYELLSIEEVQTYSLDEVLQARNEKILWGELIKLDVQGAELDILLGSKSLLQETTVAAIIEVEFCQLYENQPLFSEIEQFMRSQGFAFYGFMNFNFRSNSLRNLIEVKNLQWQERLIHADGVWFKDPFDGNANFSVRKYHALFVSSMLLGYFDLAAEILKRGLMHNENRSEMLTLIEELATKC